MNLQWLIYVHWRCLNIELAAWADEVTEVVAGCPVIWKK